MPKPGDQHQSWSNPYEEARPRVSEWTARDIATIASKLDKQLGPEYISARAGPGGTKVHYLTAEKCITLANEVFGFNGWSSSIQNIQIDFADENPQTQRVSIGLSVIVRITLRDGTYHEDVGYGSIDNAKGKAMAFEKAKKEGTTDGLKRALRNFGNLLGNCIYDKDYVKQVVKMKAEPVKKFDQNNLHRHADYVRPGATKAEPLVPAAPVPAAPVAMAVTTKTEPSESFEEFDFLGELDEADFCVPEDVTLDDTMQPPPGRADSAPAPPQRQSSVGSIDISRAPQTPGAAQRPMQQSIPAGQPQRQGGPQTHNSNPPAANNSNSAMNPPETVAFFSAKALSQLPEGDTNIVAKPGMPKTLFNPKAESPSIRRTPGIDHTSSRPLARTGQHVAPSASQAGSSTASGMAAGGAGNGGNFTPVRPGAVTRASGAVNQPIDHTRRIGAPGGGGSPLANRGSYKPPSMKRAPLTELPANGSTTAVSGATGDAQGDAKRQKTT
ncbi:rad52/22 family double-strand break repair protein [Sarocladium implicatum]|nr:rad52/22 family double-strand break repair protein [Sarocladium implicatum]